MLYEGGLSVRTTLDPKLQVLARKALVDGLVRFDETEGWRGPVTEAGAGRRLGGEARRGQAIVRYRAVAAAVVLETGEQSARVGLYPTREPGGALTQATGRPASSRWMGVRWARPAEGPRRGRTPTRVNQVLNVGDVVYVEPMTADSKAGARAKPGGCVRCRSCPAASLRWIPNTGRVLAMVGGFSFDQSQFNRATQAMRQPGSSFKPFVYAAALDNGYTPSTVVVDAPIEIDQGPGQPPWRPENYATGKYYGPQTLRFGIEHSRNMMTVRLAQDIGMPMIAEYSRRFGIYDSLPPYLSFSLGAGETTVLRMTAAYAMLDNGGRRIQPTFIDRIQDRYGRTIYRHDQRECRRLLGRALARTSRSRRLVDRREQVIDPMTAYQITSMMEGVVQRGTATVVRKVGKPIAGKTGTTNEEKRRLVRRLLAGSRRRRLSRPRQAAADRARRDRRRTGGPDRHRVHARGAGRQAGGAVPGAGRHQAGSRRRQDRHARRGGGHRRQRDPGSLQARHRTA